MPVLVAAPDKFRGTATAAQVSAAAAAAATSAGWTCRRVPMSDGGEGLLDVLGGPNRSTMVTGPGHQRVEAAWRLDGTTAIIESAEACGLTLAGGPDQNDPLGATTAGVGELLAAALDAGARRIVVGLGGTATTDGGLGCVAAGPTRARCVGVEIVVACDVDTSFVDAAAVFAAQKGASPSQVAFLERRLAALAQRYAAEFDVDVTVLAGGGAAGGLAGGLAVLGGRLVRGVDVVADALHLDDRMEGADAVITGEGYLDAQSFDGKVVGGVLERVAGIGCRALVVVGDRDPDVAAPPGAVFVSLTDTYGADRAWSETTALIEAEVARFLAASGG